MAQKTNRRNGLISLCFFKVQFVKKTCSLESQNRQEAEVTQENIDILENLNLEAESDLQKLVKVSDDVEFSAEIFIPAELTRLFILLDRAIDSQTSGSELEFRNSLTVTSKVFSDYLSDVDKKELPTHLQPIYDKMVSITKTLKFYLTMDTFEVAALIDHLQRIIVQL